MSQGSFRNEPGDIWFPGKTREPDDLTTGLIGAREIGFFRLVTYFRKNL